MGSIKPGEARYFHWGNEPAGMVTTWTVTEDRSVKLLGYITLREALDRKLRQECPYP